MRRFLRKWSDFVQKVGAGRLEKRPKFKRYDEKEKHFAQFVGQKK